MAANNHFTTCHLCEPLEECGRCRFIHLKDIRRAGEEGGDKSRMRLNSTRLVSVAALRHSPWIKLPLVGVRGEHFLWLS